MPIFTEPGLITLPAKPRIISLVPSLTELLYDLGLDEELIGLTRFCVHPGQWFRTRTRIGGTKDLKLPLIDSLQPDLVIASREENVKEQVEELAGRCAVWLTDISTLADALLVIGQAGRLFRKENNSAVIVQGIQKSFAGLSGFAADPIDTAYLIWKKPYMTVGGDTFIHDVMSAAGFRNVFGNELRYPATTVEELRDRNPSLLLLSSEPYPFRDKDLEELQSALPGMMILLADGEMFSWYGSRLQYTAAHLRSLRTLTQSSS